MNQFIKMFFIALLSMYTLNASAMFVRDYYAPNGEFQTLQVYYDHDTYDRARGSNTIVPQGVHFGFKKDQEGKFDSYFAIFGLDHYPLGRNENYTEFLKVRSFYSCQVDPSLSETKPPVKLNIRVSKGTISCFME